MQKLEKETTFCCISKDCFFVRKKRFCFITNTLTPISPTHLTASCFSIFHPDFSEMFCKVRKEQTRKFYRRLRVCSVVFYSFAPLLTIITSFFCWTTFVRKFPKTFFRHKRSPRRPRPFLIVAQSFLLYLIAKTLWRLLFNFLLPHQSKIKQKI